MPSARPPLTNGDSLRAATVVDAAPVNRLGIAVIGQGVPEWSDPLFTNLRAHGTYFGNIKPDNGLALLRATVEARAKAHPLPFGHWYVERFSA